MGKDLCDLRALPPSREQPATQQLCFVSFSAPGAFASQNVSRPLGRLAASDISDYYYYYDY